MRLIPIFALVSVGLSFLGCTPTIRMETPDKPLEINMNVKIDHQIKVQVDKQLETVMETNEDIF